MAVEVSPDSIPVEEYLRKISSLEKETDILISDHNYAKPWNEHSDSQHSKPTRLLFMKSLLKTPASLPAPSDDVEIDIESEPLSIMPPYDNVKTRAFMTECDRFVKTTMTYDAEEDRERLLNKSGWTIAQTRLYKQMMKVLQGSRLARLANENVVNEPVKRKISIDKAARRIRQVFATNGWDMSLLAWVHKIFVDYLSESMLSEYFEILRSLKAKIPNVIDKLLARANPANSSIDSLNQLLKKPWDPVASLLNQYKPPKLPGNPLIAVVPNAPNQPPSLQSHRMKFWQGQLGALGKLVHIPVHMMPSDKSPMDECLDQTYTIVRNKVMELKKQSPQRPVVLLAWSVGSLVACHVALQESVAAIVCLGFPLKGISGPRGDLNDPLLELNVPTFFAIGQNANMCSVDDMEDFRERMKADTGLVVVGGADDMLRVSITKKKSEGVTQAMVDRCVIQEISDFLSTALSLEFPDVFNQASTSQNNASVESPVPPIEEPEESPADDAKRKRRKPREYSPEICPIRRKQKISRQSTAKKMSVSSTGSETSIGSCASENPNVFKEVKIKSPGRRVGRPPGVSSSKRQSLHEAFTRNYAIPRYSASTHMRQNMSPPKEPFSPSQQTYLSTQALTKEVQKEQPKNTPVDVEKAFGRDSSFLPRPLTPADFVADTSSTSFSNQTVTSTESLKDEISNLESTNALIATLQTDCPNSSAFSNTLNTPLITSTVNNFQLAKFSTNVNSTVAIQKPKVISKIAESNTITKSPSQLIEKLQYHNFPLANINKGSLLQGILSSSENVALQRNAPQIVINKLSSNIPSKPHTLSIDSNNTISSFSPNNDNLSSGNLQLQKLLSTPINSNPLLSKLSTPILSSTITSGSSLENVSSPPDNQSCNLSLLSDVAGLKEPVLQKPITQETRPASGGATVVKLSSSEGFHIPLKEPGRKVRIIEALPVSIPQRYETAEELVEKQRAIQALNNSLKDNGSGSKEYGFDYPRPGTSSMLNYPFVPTRGRRGRGAPSLGRPPKLRFL